MHKHAAKTLPSNPANALLTLPMLVVERPAEGERIALAEFASAQYQKERAMPPLFAAAKAANQAMRDARYNYPRSAMEDAAEQAYAKLVMLCMYIQADVDEWSLPTIWTDGFVDEEGYVTVYNNGSEDFGQAYQGSEVEYVKVDENGLGMRMDGE